MSKATMGKMIKQIPHFVQVVYWENSTNVNYLANLTILVKIVMNYRDFTEIIDTQGFHITTKEESPKNAAA